MKWARDAASSCLFLIWRFGVENIVAIYLTNPNICACTLIIRPTMLLEIKLRWSGEGKDIGPSPLHYPKLKQLKPCSQLRVFLPPPVKVVLCRFPRKSCLKTSMAANLESVPQTSSEYKMSKQLLLPRSCSYFSTMAIFLFYMALVRLCKC